MTGLDVKENVSIGLGEMCGGFGWYGCSGDSVYELNEVAAAKGCLGRFPGGEMMGIIKKFINLDAGTD